MHRLLIVDDHPVYRLGLKVCLAQALADAVVSDVESANHALEYITRFPDTDLVLIDVRMPQTDGFALLRQIGDQNPQVARVLISGDDDPELSARAQANGAAGFVPKASSIDQCIQAIRLVLAGGVWFGQTLSGSEPVATPEASLTLRQLQVLGLLAQGHPNKSIARAMNLSERTVKAHLTGAFEALNAKSRTQALMEARRRGLVKDRFE